jgi:hypothetical protein
VTAQRGHVGRPPSLGRAPRFKLGEFGRAHCALRGKEKPYPGAMAPWRVRTNALVFCRSRQTDSARMRGASPHPAPTASVHCFTLLSGTWRARPPREHVSCRLLSHALGSQVVADRGGCGLRFSAPVPLPSEIHNAQMHMHVPPPSCTYCWFSVIYLSRGSTKRLYIYTYGRMRERYILAHITTVG